MRFSNAITQIDRAGLALAGASCAVLCLLTIGAIGYRLLGYPFYWAAEYSTFLLVFLVLLPQGEITRRDGQLAADFLLQAMGGNFEWLLRRYLVPVIMLLFALVLFFLAGNRMIATLQDGIRSNGPLRTPLVVPQAVMVLGLAGMVLSAACRLFEPVPKELDDPNAGLPGG